MLILMGLLLELPVGCNPTTESLRSARDQAVALELLQQKVVSVADCNPEDTAWLTERGWWAAARELVQRSHEEADAKQRQAIETVVRREANNLKRRSDELLLSLSPQESSKIGVVRCAFQWAQNSTTIFLSVKFSHRWSSPGALKVHDEQVNVSSCCFNFTAEGEHSQLHKRYSLDLHFLHEVKPDLWSWQLASAGRFTVEVQKRVPGVWERLLHGKEKPGSMAAWESMNQRYKKELKEFKQEELKKRKLKLGDDEEAEREKERHEDLRLKCGVHSSSPWVRSGSMPHLCDKYWPPRMKGRMGKEATWLILFFSGKEMECKTRGEQCAKVRSKWTTVFDKLSDMTSAKVGVVDCDQNKDFCEKEKVGFMPFVRRHRKGKRKPYRGDWDVPSLGEFVSETEQ
jgi:hypothetical protein